MHFYYELFSTFMLAFYIMYWSSCLYYLIPVLVLHFSNSLPEVRDEKYILVPILIFQNLINK